MSTLTERYKRLVMGRYQIVADEDEHGEEEKRELTELEQALKHWVETNNERKLVDLYKRAPHLFHPNPHGEATTTTMYRGIAIPRTAAQNLIDHGKPLQKKGQFESWTTDESTAEEFLRGEEHNEISIMLKKKPNKVLLEVCEYLTNEDFDSEQSYCHENEFLALAEQHKLEDIKYAIGSKKGDVLYADSDQTREQLKSRPPMVWFKW